jgi:hypothetical protein
VTDTTKISILRRERTRAPIPLRSAMSFSPLKTGCCLILGSRSSRGYYRRSHPRAARWHRCVARPAECHYDRQSIREPVWLKLIDETLVGRLRVRPTAGILLLSVGQRRSTGISTDVPGLPRTVRYSLAFLSHSRSSMGCDEPKILS